MICALHWKLRGVLPESQKKIVDKLCETLLERDRLSQLDVEFPEAYAELTPSQRRGIVQKLAEYMLTEEISVIGEEVARRKCADVLFDVKGRSADDADVVLDYLVERSGLLQRPSPERIDFLHNTFKEMLAGERLAIEERYSLLVRKISGARNETWRRAGLFAAADDDHARGFASTLLAKLIPMTETNQKRTKETAERRQQLRMTRMFAVRCGAVAEYLSDVATSDVARIVGDLLPPQSLDEAEALSELGELAVEHLAPYSRMSEAKAAASVRMLRLIDTSSSQKTIELYCEREEDSVLAELVQAVADPIRLPGIRRHIDSGTFPALRFRPQGHFLRYLTDLTSLSGLAWASELQSLDLTSTGVIDVSPLANLPALLSLDLALHEGTEAIVKTFALTRAAAELAAVEIRVMNSAGLREVYNPR